MLTNMDCARLLDLAIQHHRSGRLAEAETVYRQILSDDPKHADATHFLGMLALQTGQGEIALNLINRAIGLKPNAADYHNSLGLTLKAVGQIENAIAAFHHAIQIQPDYAVAYYNLGLTDRDRGDLDAAISAFRSALRFAPTDFEIHNDLGIALKANGSLDEAIAAYQSALQLNANYAAAHYNLALIWRELGEAGKAIASMEHAASLNPQFRGEAHNYLGYVLQHSGQIYEAIDHYREAVRFEPANAWFHTNLGTALTDAGRPAEAIIAHRASLQLDPSLAEAHYNLAIALLLNGEWHEGWLEYEWRTQVGPLNLPLTLQQPRWHGDALRGRRILLTTEQGLGDIIQFVRYVQMVAERGGQVILSGPPILQRLLQCVAGLYCWIAPDQHLPDFDVHCPLLSLPMVMETTLDTVPKHVPYLFADFQLARQWQLRIPNDSRLKVGLVWAGNVQPVPHRSIPLSALQPLVRANDVWFCSLQKGEAGAQSSSPPSGLKLVDWTSELSDFADTAALIANLDLIISIDTSVAHLAGAMGKPVWLLVLHVPDWRWGLSATTSPWYPSMRLFRQREPNNWNSSIEEVSQALQELAAQKSRV